MTATVDVTGQRFGRLTALHKIGKAGPYYVWLCRCDCGGEARVRITHLKNGNTTSCGCARVVHGHAQGRKCSPTYSSWKAMTNRCTLPSSAGFAHYRKLGITVCERWRIFENFLTDMGERPSLTYTLDRFPNRNGNYEPGNCRWATRREQANNRSTNRLFEFQGELLTYREIARRTGMNDETLRHRLLRAGWTVEEALYFPRPVGRPKRKAID